MECSCPLPMRAKEVLAVSCGASPALVRTVGVGAGRVDQCVTVGTGPSSYWPDNCQPVCAQRLSKHGLSQDRASILNRVPTEQRSDAGDRRSLREDSLGRGPIEEPHLLAQGRAEEAKTLAFEHQRCLVPSWAERQLHKSQIKVGQTHT